MPPTRQVYRRSPKVAGDATSGSTLILTEEEPITLTDLHSILIRVHAVSLNYRDVNIIHGTNPWAVKADGIPCSDAAGVVVEIGSKVTDFQVGDKVSPIFDQLAINGTEQSRQWLGGEVDGVLATHVVFPAEKCVKFPEHLSFEEAACLPNAGITAWSALMGTRGELQVGKTVLIQGTGGVSMMAVKMARVAGCKVILTSSSDEKLERVRRECENESRPKIQVVNYKTNERWDEEVVRLNGGRGVDIAIENGGNSTLKRTMGAMAKKGVIGQVGYLGGQSTAGLDGMLSTLIDKTITLQGINVGSKLDQDKMNQAIAANEMRLTDVIDRTFQFDEAIAAMEYLWSGQHVGKVVIQVKQ
ncbi:hypothetical protein M409DRAFT_61828 [Zasmidium cellare ATCC 36951]|uniref:Enoyl reductase (ER) domain-containing protein n=1 Tax=Zasmidium cellare ATCC 36951 TaxID=1080233 RepID=A0A6A6D4Q4_ZASCE|nr:uncharacterized protein M409DRAFT_61828 [Zasmidium cellare ATCC 36951]KAF2173398.1 hypothetical protein M409DRAFT_61828 [Zasmidium cellare ATCC 36951]